LDKSDTTQLVDFKSGTKGGTKWRKGNYVCVVEGGGLFVVQFNVKKI